MNARTNSHLHVAVLDAVVDRSRQWGSLRLDVTYPSQPHGAITRHHHLRNAIRVLVEVHFLVVGKSVRNGVVGGGLFVMLARCRNDCLMGFAAWWKQHSFMSRTISFDLWNSKNSTIIAYLRKDARVLG